MFKRRTLFVLGAGASAEVNLPVGTQLAKNIGSKLDIRFEHGFTPVGSGDFELYEQFKRAFPQESRSYQTAAWLIRDGIQLSSSIDDFLDLHRNNAEVNLYGKAAIAKSILEAERESLLYFNRAKGEETIKFDLIADTWLVKFMKILARGLSRQNVAQIFDNISFIVFNYDRCIEHFLVHALQRLYGIDEKTAQEICCDLHIIHPYGCVGQLPTSSNLGVPFGTTDTRDCLTLAHGIKTYTEQITDASDLLAIEAGVLSARCIVFLGFAYHDQNMLMLTPKKALDYMPVYGTAYGMSDDDTAVVTQQIEGMFAPAQMHRIQGLQGIEWVILRDHSGGNACG